MSRKRRIVVTGKDGLITEDHDDGYKETESPRHPTRDTTMLFASPETVDCAHKCVPCGYKIGAYDVALDSDFCKNIPNERPEMCPRASNKSALEPTMGYRRNMRVLTIGDGDFTFSLALARLLRPIDTSSALVATSYEDKETLRNVYPNFDETLEELQALGATACFKVDATRLAETLPRSASDQSYHRICWNFPCTAIAKGQDGQNGEMEHNKELVRKFVANSRHLLFPGDGEIHICHKTKPPFNQWKLELVALENLKDGDGPALEYAGRVVLDRFLLPPYTPRKALNRKSFPCHDACFYIFSQPQGGKICDSKMFAPTIDPNSGRNLPSVAVVKDTIASIRKSLLLVVASKPQKKSNPKRNKTASYRR